MDDLKEKIEKLPKWAKDHIKRLEIQNKHYKEILESQQESDVWTGSELNKDRIFLPCKKVTFRLNDCCDDYIQIKLQEKHGSKEKMLRIMGGDQISIIPEAANVVNIQLARRD